MSKLKWSVVMCTAPRKYPKIQTTIDCLAEAGWLDPVIFSEPDSFVSTAKTIHNEKKLGVWKNWLKSANYALNTDADVIMTVQDDIWIHPESKQFAEGCLWPKDCGYLSLYTPAHYSTIKGVRKPWGIYPITTKSVWGAMCLVWHPETLRQVVNADRGKNWVGLRSRLGTKEYNRRKENSQLVRNADTVLGHIINRDLGKKIYYCNPSCCQHISEDSSIGGRPAAGNRAASFVAGKNGCPNPLKNLENVVDKIQ
jgi:hypothetical protein